LVKRPSRIRHKSETNSQRVWKWEEEAKEKLKQNFRGRVRLKKTYYLSMLRKAISLAHGCN
jgi:hypothetical protein